MTNTTHINANTGPSAKQPEIPSLAEADLRDYFAAKAIGEAFRFRQPGTGAGGGSFEYVAKIAYQVADAMLAERAK